VSVLKYFFVFLMAVSALQAQVFHPPIQHIADNIPDFNFKEIKSSKIK